MEISHLYQKAPCKDCPFKKDCVKGRLGKERSEQILSDESFTCHKTSGSKRKQCAGFMMLKGDESKFVQNAELFKIDLGLIGREKVFDTKEDCVEHHSREFEG